METLNEKFFNVTGLTWDLKQYIESLKNNGMTDEQISEKILWFIPDGVMIELEGRRQSLTKELLSDETLAELGIQESDKIGPFDNDDGNDDDYIIDTDFGKVIVFIPNNEVGEKINVQNFNSRYFDEYPYSLLYQTINDSTVIICDSYDDYIIENAYDESYKDSTFMNLNYDLYNEADNFSQYIKYEEYDGTNASENINIFIPNHEVGSEFTLVFGDDYDDSTFNYNQITINSMKIDAITEICTEFTPTDNPRVFKGILKHKIEGNFTSETTIKINATMIPEIRLENFYGDAKINISGKEAGSEVRIFGLPEGYTPLSLLYYTVGDMSGKEVVNKFNHVIEDEIDIWKGYNLIENISNSSFDDVSFSLRLKKPNGSISNVYFYSENLIIEGQPVVDIYIYNETGNDVHATFLNNVLGHSEFRPMELIQVQDDQDVILTKFDDGEYEGILLNKYKEPDGDTTTAPFLIMKKTIDVVEGNPSENPEYTTPELYVSENNATLLLKDEFVDKYNFEVYRAYQINEEGNLIDLASEFNKDSNTGFIYHYSDEINNYNNELDTIITIRSNNLNIQVYTPEQPRNAIIYYDDTVSSNTVTIEFINHLTDPSIFTPGKLCYIDNDEDVVLVSEGNWTYLGHNAYSATLETNYDYQEPVYVDVFVYGEYCGSSERCEVYSWSYVPPQPNKLFIGSNEAGNTVTLVIGGTSSLDYETVGEDYNLIGVYDNNDVNIMNSFSNNNDGSFTGTLLAPINDINSDGYMIFEDIDNEQTQELVKFIEEDY